MTLKFMPPSLRLPLKMPQLRQVDWGALLYHEEKIGGLAISEAGVALAYLARRKHQATLPHQPDILLQKESPLPTGTIEAGALKKADVLERALRELISRTKLPSQSVVLSLPSAVCQPFIFEFLPNLRPEEITSAISLIVDSSLPLPRSEIYADWEEIRGSAIGKRKFLLAMGLRELIDPYVAAVRKIGLVPVACETHGWSLSRSIPLRGEPVLALTFETSQVIFSAYLQNTLVFQFDLPRTVLTTLSQLSLASVKSVPAKPPLVTVSDEQKEAATESQSVPEPSGKSKQRGRKKKESPGSTPIVSPRQSIPTSRIPPLSDFYTQVAVFSERIIHFLISDPEYNFAIEKILVLAPTKEREALASALPQDLKGRLEPEAGSGRPLALLALGAAARGLLPRREDTISSLLPIGTELAYERARALSFLDFFQKLVVALGGFFILLFAGSLVLVNIIARNTDRALERQQVSIPGELGTIRNAAQIFNQHVNVLSALQKRTPNWDRVFGELGFLASPGLSITTLDLSLTNPLTIVGTAKSRDALLELKAVLDSHPTFSPITLPLSILLGKENLPFSLKVEFKNRSIFQR